MPKKQLNAHHHVTAICMLPIALLAIASVWNEIELTPDIAHAEETANRTEQKLVLLDTRFRDMQKAYSLLTQGEEKVLYSSMASQYFKENLASPIDREENASKNIATLTQRITAFENTFKEMGDKAIHIDLSSQEAALIKGGVIVKRYPVSSGSPATPTPRGKFQIQRKQELRVSQQDVPYRMPNYMAFTPDQGYGMHALPYLGNGPESSDFWQEALDHIGIPVSHGCIRLLPDDAAELFGEVEIGTPVYINT